jgi:thiamine-monophosphate kinase
MTERVGDIGEFGLIARIREVLEAEGRLPPGAVLGLGDDAACFTPRPGCEILVTCDAMVEGRHFLAERTSARDLGRRAMVMNISDIGAMGGTPCYALVSLGLPARIPVAFVEDLYRGFLMELNPFSAGVFGGNLTSTNERLFIDITLIGEVRREHLMRRSTARAGDAILVTGYPGQAAGGLHLLVAGSAAPDLANHPLVRAYQLPRHRAREGREVARSGLASAMIDMSDGLLGDLGHICEQSGLGALLVQELLPVSDVLRAAALESRRDPFDWVLGDSDDYELILTCPSERVESLRALIHAVAGAAVSEVGRLTEAWAGIRIRRPDGSEGFSFPAGWDHFRRRGGGSQTG